MKKISFYFIVTLIAQFGFSQVGIGTTTPAGALDINSTTNGLVLPRVALTAKNVAAPVVNPQTGALVVGTMVYNTATAGTGVNSVTPGFFFWNGTSWDKLNNATKTATSQTSTTVEPNANITGTLNAITLAGTNGAAQTFDNNTTFVSKTINVSGYTGVTGLVTCRVRFNHTFPLDADLYLQSPTGQIIELSTDNGDFVGTVPTFDVTFSDSGASNISDWFSGNIAGTFKPEGTLTIDGITPNITTMSGFNGNSPNGTWTLRMRDDTATDNFSYLNFSLRIATSNTPIYTLAREVGPIVYNAGNAIVVSGMYSCNTLDEDGFVTALTYSTTVTGAEGVAGPSTLPTGATTLNYASGSPKQGLGNYWATTYNQAVVDQSNGLINGSSYYFQLWKKGNVELPLNSNRQSSLIANQIQN